MSDLQATIDKLQAEKTVWIASESKWMALYAATCAYYDKRIAKQLEIDSQAPVRWSAILSDEQIPQQSRKDMHDVCFKTEGQAKVWVAEQQDGYGWLYKIQPLYSSPRGDNYNGHDAKYWNQIAVDRFKEILELEEKVAALETSEPPLVKTCDREVAAITTLQYLKYTYSGGAYWKPPLSPKTADNVEQAWPAKVLLKDVEVPTQPMLRAARDWSYEKYGMPIGDDAANGCWKVMHKAALQRDW